MNWISSIRIILLLGILVSCQSLAMSTVPSQRVATPSGMSDINSVTMSRTGMLVVSDARRIWYRDANSNEWNELVLTDQSTCQRFFLQLQFLPDGRLAMICSGGEVDGRIMFSLVAYDWVTNKLINLIPGYLPDNGEFSFNQSMSRGAYTNVDAYSTLFFLTPQGVAPIPVRLVDGSKSWVLSDSVRARAEWLQNVRVHEGNHPVGLAHTPAWSPTSDTVAFWATLEPIGQQYELRTYQWTLYLLNASNLSTQSLISGVGNPLSLAWNPTGDILAFSSQAGGIIQQGVWIYSIPTGKSSMLSEGVFNRVAWSPTDEILYAVQCHDVCGKNDELIQFDMHSFLP